MQRSVTVYTQAKLESLWSELAGLPSRIQTAKDDSAQHEKKLQTLQPLLDKLNRDEIIPVKTTMTAIKARIHVLTLPGKIAELAADIQQHLHALNELEPQREQVAALLAPIDDRITKLKTAIELCLAQDILTQKGAALQEELLTVDSLQAVVKQLTSQRDSEISQKNIIKSKLVTLRAELQKVQSPQPANSGYESSPQKPADGYSSSPQRPDKNNESALKAKIDEAESDLQGCKTKINDLKGGVRQGEFDLGKAEARKAQLNKDIRQLDVETQKRQRALSGFSYSLDRIALEKELSQENNRRLPHARQLEELDAAIKQHQSEKLKLESKKRKRQLLYDQSLPLSSPFLGNVDLDQLNKLLADNKRIHRELKARRTVMQRDIDASVGKKSENDLALAAMLKRQKSLEENQFLMAFRDRPAELLSRLFASLQKALPEFDYAHPAGLSEQVRIALMTLQAKADFIMQRHADKNVIMDFRKKYFQLSGLIFGTIEGLKSVPSSQAFKSVLNKVLGEDVVESSEARAEYATLQRYNKEALRDVSLAELKEYEVRNYRASINHFDTVLKHVPENASSAMKTFYRKGNALLASIQEEDRLADKSRGVIRFNFRLHHEILKNASALLQNPENQMHHQRLAMLAQCNKNGQPSVVKKVFGAIAMFLGAAAAVVGGLFLAGVLPVVSWPVSVAMIAGGASMFAGGVALCVHGRKKGLAKALDNFENSANVAVKAERENTVKSYRHTGMSFFSGADMAGVGDGNDDLLLRFGQPPL